MIKLLVPDMPTADDLLPYLRLIDRAKVYVNRGPLVQELEARLEEITGVPCVAVSNGTVALELALQSQNLCQTVDDNGYLMHGFVAVPALTFSASGLSIARNTLTPMLCDVDSTWHLAPSLVDDECKPRVRANDSIEAVMPVSAFGYPVEISQWEGYNVPVIIDAAGAFPSQVCSKDQNIATCFSLHATKYIGCGEGGFVASANKALVEEVRSLSMFGESGTNAKMSEYHAAVALASLDRMDGKKKRSQAVAKWYFQNGIADDFKNNCFGPVSYDDDEVDGGSAEYTLSTLMNVLLPVPVAEVIPQMLAAGIETKQWYRPYLDERPEFGAHQAGRFPVTDHLRTHLLGIPFHNFLTEEDVKHICDTLRNILLSTK